MSGAFASMMNGSECSTGANPLASLLKQQGTDNSLHHSGFQQQQGSSSSSMRSHPGQPGLQHEEAERFFQQQQHGGGGAPNQFAMEGLRRELESVARGEQKGPIIGDRGQSFWPSRCGQLCRRAGRDRSSASGGETSPRTTISRHSPRRMTPADALSSLLQNGHRSTTRPAAR